MFTISKEFHFSAGHHLTGLPETHPCSEVHGHNYVVTVELRVKKRKELTPVGFVQDYRELEPIKQWIDKNLDHKDLNKVFNFNPTAELMAEALYNMFKEKFPKLSAVSVSETPKTTARYSCD
jgi:6-pyruvoyltetrahydropterin/6-carboxytetrahydropterin synthase